MTTLHNTLGSLTVCTALFIWIYHLSTKLDSVQNRISALERDSAFLAEMQEQVLDIIQRMPITTQEVVTEMQRLFGLLVDLQERIGNRVVDKQIRMVQLMKDTQARVDMLRALAMQDDEEGEFRNAGA